MIPVRYPPDYRRARRCECAFLSLMRLLVDRARASASRASAVDMESGRNWVLQHKLRAVGTLWATSLLGSLAYNFTKPGMKMSVKLIHARLHAQFLTLGALGGVLWWRLMIIKQEIKLSGMRSISGLERVITSDAQRASSCPFSLSFS